ncbi:hypothetical protein PoB_004800600 [Plakobranchus ocellatus]|uniref:Uncharacterized protein n=1 Tax=Plakobranchus ocellatus TaxID=259542 RepID=A0AAV4BM26_9GAST|nr:hypothetical protein PoB_004800600 [Plakobranchus ocellatus]
MQDARSQDWPMQCKSGVGIIARLPHGDPRFFSLCMVRVQQHDCAHQGQNPRDLENRGRILPINKHFFKMQWETAVTTVGSQASAAAPHFGTAAFISVNIHIPATCLLLARLSSRLFFKDSRLMFSA